MPTKHKNATKALIRFYPGPDDDLLAWLETLDKLPFGAKGQALKATLRRGLGMVMSAADSPTATTALELSELRKVLELVLDERLSRYTLQNTTPILPDVEETEAAALLDRLSANLLLDME